MDFLNREDELGRLDRLIARAGGFAVVYGRRRIGKTRLLVEWVQRHRGVYTVADQSAQEVQRRYFATALAAVLPGFGDVSYSDWRTLLARLAREALAVGWRGPLVFDEFPYLVQQAPDLPAAMQRWIDHQAQHLVVVIAGSSQHLMQGLVLAADAPLFGRAQALFEVLPLRPTLLRNAIGASSGADVVDAYTAWGGVPRYWELAADVPGTVFDAIDDLVLDPMGPLHREPDRVIAEELPPVTQVRGLLDAIGGGAHRASEIAGRIGQPTTSLSRALQRIQEMGLVRREIPFGASARDSKRSLYRIADPFTRLWFRVVAPHRGPLATSTSASRRQLLHRYWPALRGEAWEDLCRLLLPGLSAATELGRLGPWQPPQRWWHRNEPEWDLVARSIDGSRLLVGEVKSSAAPLADAQRALAARELPAVSNDQVEVVRALFVIAPEGKRTRRTLVCSASDLLGFD